MLRRTPPPTPPTTRPARQTRPAKNQRAAPSPTAVGQRLTGGIGQFIFETRSELKKVVWPTREQAVNLTALVIAVSAAVAAFIGAVDWVLAQFFQKLVGA
jgi:preprotein translocase subunit SecE